MCSVRTLTHSRTCLHSRKREIREKSNSPKPITIFSFFSFSALVEGLYFWNLQNANANLPPIYEPSSSPEKVKNEKEVLGYKFLLFLFFWRLARLAKGQSPVRQKSYFYSSKPRYVSRAKSAWRHSGAKPKL